jgi:hypothetical protein
MWCNAAEKKRGGALVRAPLPVPIQALRRLAAAPPRDKTLVSDGVAALALLDVVREVG